MSDIHQLFISPDGRWRICECDSFLDQWGDHEDPSEYPQRASVAQILCQYDPGRQIDLMQVGRFQVNTDTVILQPPQTETFQITDYPTAEEAFIHVKSRMETLSAQGKQGTVTCQTLDGAWHFYAAFKPLKKDMNRDIHE